MLTPILVGFLITVGVLLVVGDIGRRRDGDAIQLGPLATFLEGIQIDLEEAGMAGMSPERFLLISAGVGLVTGLSIVVLTGYTIIGTAIGLLVATVGMRNLYVRAAASKRRLLATLQVANACRDIADAIDAGETVNAALEAYARRAKPNAASEAITGEEQIIAKAILDALHLRDTKGAKQDVALRRAAEEVGNRYFRQFVETIIATADISGEQLAAGLRRLATEIDYAVALRRERMIALNPPINSYKTVGVILVGLVAISSLISPVIGSFYSSVAGQIVLLVMAGWWTIGYTIVRRNLKDRL
jgi:tight adherence protein B